MLELIPHDSRSFMAAPINPCTNACMHNVAQALTHYKFPLAACSLSIASNKLLKFPAPKPSKLFL